MKPHNAAELASYRRAERVRQARAEVVRMEALIRDWHRQRNIVLVLKRFWRVSMWLFVALAIVSSLSIITRVI